MKEKITLREARRMAASSTGFPPAFGSGIEGALAALRRLGAIQIDTISVVERAHHHILWSRVGRYDKDSIPTLEAPPRRAFEYWSHAAAYLPLEEYRFSLSRMERIKAQGHEWFRADPMAVEWVRDRVTAEGPLRSQDFAEPLQGPRGWWGWKPAKVALEYLFHSGELAVLTRRGFQKVYDLPERCLPADLDLRRPSPREESARHVDRAILSLGIFARDEVAYMRKDGLPLIDEEIASRLEAGSLLEIEIEGDDAVPTAKRRSRRYFAAPGSLEAAAARPARPAPKAFLLSPFDPFVIDRRRLSRLFGIDYQVECYVPEPKRKFGYYALPLLFRDGRGDFGMAALVDVKVDRKARRLDVRRLSLLPGEGLFAGKDARPLEAKRRPGTRGRELAEALASELARYAAFNGAGSVVVEAIVGGDGAFAAELGAALDRATIRDRGRS